MARPRQPIALVQAKGKKNLTKKEITERQSSEVQPDPTGIAAPSFLTVAQRRTFDQLADQLKSLGIMGGTDNDALARYIVAQDNYAAAVKDLRGLRSLKPKKTGDSEVDVENAVSWAGMLNQLDKRVARYFDQAHAAASALGMTISSRCKLVVPKSGNAEPPRNKFADLDDPEPEAVRGA